MDMEWVFPIEGATARSGRAVEAELRAIDGMVAADVDIQASLVKLTLTQTRSAEGEILAILGDRGCVPHRPPYVGPEPVTARSQPEMLSTETERAQSGGKAR